MLEKKQFLGRLLNRIKNVELRIKNLRLTLMQEIFSSTVALIRSITHSIIKNDKSRFFSYRFGHCRFEFRT